MIKQQTYVGMFVIFYLEVYLGAVNQHSKKLFIYFNFDQIKICLQNLNTDKNKKS
jgi:hypothetical protein